MSKIKRSNIVLVTFFLAVALFYSVNRISASTLGDCSSLNKDELKRELLNTTSNVFKSSNTNIDKIAERSWYEVYGDDVLISIISNETSKVSQQTGFIDKLVGSFSKSDAKKYTEQILERTFSSTEFNILINDFSNHISEKLIPLIEEASENASMAGMDCLRSFAGARYGQALTINFENHIMSGIQDVDLTGKSNMVSSVDTLSQHSKGVAGIVALTIGKKIGASVGKKIATRLASTLGKKIVGQVVTKFIPLVGWGLLAYDIIDSGTSGPFSMIEKNLISPDTISAMRKEILNTTSSELKTQLPDLVKNISDELFRFWSGFILNYQSVTMMAEQNPAYNDLLFSIPENEFDKLAKITKYCMSTLDRSVFEKSIENGEFAQLLTLQTDPTTILGYTRSIAETLKWKELAGEYFDQVVATEVYKLRTPENTSLTQLQSLFTLDTPAQVRKAASLNENEFGILLQLPKKTTVKLLSLYDISELSDKLITYSGLEESNKKAYLNNILAKSKDGSESSFNVSVLPDTIKSLPGYNWTNELLFKHGPLSLVIQIVLSVIVLAIGLKLLFYIVRRKK
jgi:hypothetical protein